MPAPATRDYFAELYVAGLFGDAGWSVYFPKRDVGFDFIASKSVNQEVILRAVQVKGKYATLEKGDQDLYGFRGHLTATHRDMVLAIPYFEVATVHSPVQVAFMPVDQFKSWDESGIRCAPARLKAGKIEPRPTYQRYFGANGLQLVEASNWGRGA